jgi:tetratricopeptide (TPR) repeat protein
VPPKLEKALKQPDQFVSFWSKVGDWATARRKAMLVLAVVMVGGTALGWGVQGYLQSRAERASQAFARIHRVATAALIPEKGEASFDDDLPHFKTERERLDAAVKEADSFIAGHGGSPLREKAELLKARYLVALGRAADAVPVYQRLTSSLDERLRFLAQEGLAYAQEESGQIDKALETLAALAERAKSNGNFFRDRALFNRARLLERKGDTKAAQKTYREVLSEVPTTALKEEINNRLAVLEGK